MSRDCRRYAAARTEGQASDQIQVPPFQPAAARVYPTTYHIYAHFRLYVIACVLATAFLSRHQLAQRPPH